MARTGKHTRRAREIIVLIEGAIVVALLSRAFNAGRSRQEKKTTYKQIAKKKIDFQYTDIWAMCRARKYAD